MSDNTPIIELKNVEVTFTSRTGSLFKPNKVHAVRGVNMRIERGQTLGIVGESGCGKSTTANVMCGLQMPSAGHVFFNGKEVTRRSAAARREIGRVVSVVFQDPATALNPRMHVADQLADPLRVHGIGDAASRARRVHELISLVGLPSSALDALPGQLSGGPSPVHRPGCDHRRRAHLRTRRVGASTDPEPAHGPQEGTGPGDGLHLARYSDRALRV